jgi:hypothetical protein
MIDCTMRSSASATMPATPRPTDSSRVTSPAVRPIKPAAQSVQGRNIMDSSWRIS